MVYESMEHTNKVVPLQYDKRIISGVSLSVYVGVFLNFQRHTFEPKIKSISRYHSEVHFRNLDCMTAKIPSYNSIFLESPSYDSKIL